MASIAVATGGSLALAQPAEAVIGPGGGGPPHIIQVKTTANAKDPRGFIGQCLASPGSVCNIQSGVARTTTVTAKLGMPIKQVAADLSFSLTVTSSTVVGCTSPKLAAHQKYVAWRLGTKKVYKIQRRVATGPGKVQTFTTGWLTAWQPHRGVSILCSVVRY